MVNDDVVVAVTEVAVGAGRVPTESIYINHLTFRSGSDDAVIVVV